jgi:hypothetical protein
MKHQLHHHLKLHSLMSNYNTYNMVMPLQPTLSKPIILHMQGSLYLLLHDCHLDNLKASNNHSEIEQ